MRAAGGSRRAVGAGLIVIGVLTPLVPLALTAVSRRWPYPALAPQQFSARGLRLIVDPRSDIARALLTSTVIAATVAVLASVIGLCTGRALGLYAFAGKRAVQFLMLAPIITPALAVTLGIQVFFVHYRLADTATGVVLVHLVPTVPYVTLVMAAAFANFDLDIEDQARVLGAGAVRTLWSVTLPSVRPALAVAALFAFLISWSEYILTLLIGGGAVKTLPLLLFAYIGSADLTDAAAVSLVLILPPLVLVVAASSYLTGRHSAVVALGRR